MDAEQITSSRFRVVALAMTLVLTAQGSGTGAMTSSDEYWLPLLRDYGIAKKTARSATRGCPGSYRLARIVATSGTSRNYQFLAGGVERIGVSGHVIYGTSIDGFFLVDTSAANGHVRLYPRAQEWRADLLLFGAGGEPRLLSPDEMAARLPDHVMRPWRYRVMGRLLGWSDEAWALLVQAAGILVAALFGLTMHRPAVLVMAAVGLACAINVTAHLAIARDGQGLFPGFLLLPCAFVGVALLLRVIRGT